MTCQAILVNYHCTELIGDAVDSLPVIDGLRIDVVDNSASCEERAKLLARMPSTVNLIINKSNQGFARACNQAFAAADTEFVLLLNPDARLLPGALQRLQDTLAAHPEAAAVGPRVYWDADRHFQMPLSTFPSSRWYLLSQLARHIHRIIHKQMERQRVVALAACLATSPFAVEALSGGHMLLRRSAVHEAGGLFDPGFFMYWEDSDLIWRLKKKGFLLFQDPQAEALHFYTHSPAKEVMIGKGWASFEARHFGSPYWRLLAWIGRHGHPPKQLTHFEPVDWPDAGMLILRVPPSLHEQWILEISPAPDFTPAIAYLGKGDRIEVPSALLHRFSGCALFLRLGAAVADGREVRQHFMLTVPED